MKGHVVVFYTDLQIFLNVWTLNESYQVKLKQIHLFNLVWKDCIREIVDKMGYLQMAGFTPGSEEGILRQGLWRSSCKSGQLQVISPMWCFNFFFFLRGENKSFCHDFEDLELSPGPLQYQCQQTFIISCLCQIMLVKVLKARHTRKEVHMSSVPSSGWHCLQLLDHILV